MKYIDEYRDRNLIQKLTEMIWRSATGTYKFMEICGGHTAAIQRFGINSLLPGNISLISGPGCPVCVTGKYYIDRLVACSELDDVIIASFGDLLRIPGTDSSLEKQIARGACVRVVFSALDALNISRKESGKKIIFPGIGFETTAPGTAVAIKEAADSGVENFFVLSGHKVMPPAIESVLSDGVEINGLICPGHVASITGSSIFDFIPEKFGLGCVITGFEPLDLLEAIYLLVNQVNNSCPANEIQYRRAVTISGNFAALKYVEEVFVASNEYWRGLGYIPESGLRLCEKYRRFDADYFFPLNVEEKAENENCSCGDILKGMIKPPECSLFGIACTPEEPVGACMVSPEGACNAYFKYRKNE